MKFAELCKKNIFDGNFVLYLFPAAMYVTASGVFRFIFIELFGPMRRYLCKKYKIYLFMRALISIFFLFRPHSIQKYYIFFVVEIIG